ncbi:hypothetical protein ACNHYB_09035 [Isoptericola jiangsuensis]|uniref:hypothetical protein n=1 Tax=Isoptericola jiangsuensis TaxID=548579 RepID=UPI003AACFCE6
MAVSLAGAAGAALLGASGSLTLLKLIPIVNGATFLIAMLFTIGLPKPVLAVGHASRRGVLGMYRPTASILAVAVLLGLTFVISGVPGSAIAVLVASESYLPAWIVGASPILGLLIAVGGQRFMREHSNEVGRRLPLFVLISCSGGVIAMVLLCLVRYGVVPATSWSIALVVSADVLAEVAGILTSYAVWDVQYRVGSDADRGGIVGLFGVAASASIALSPGIAGLLLFEGAPATLMVLVLGTVATLGCSIVVGRIKRGAALSGSEAQTI